MVSYDPNTTPALQNATTPKTMIMWLPAALSVLYTVLLLPYSIQMYPDEFTLFPILPFFFGAVASVMYGRSLNNSISQKKQVIMSRNTSLITKRYFVFLKTVGVKLCRNFRLFRSNFHSWEPVHHFNDLVLSRRISLDSLYENWGNIYLYGIL